MAKNDAPEITELSNRVDGRKTGLSTQGYPLRKIVERVNGIHILSCGHRLPKPAEATDYDLRKSRRCVECGTTPNLAAPNAAQWSDEFPVDQQGYYWIQLVGSPANNVIGFISRNLIHYTNGEKERGELCREKYRFLGPISVQDPDRLLTLELACGAALRYAEEHRFSSASPDSERARLKIIQQLTNLNTPDAVPQARQETKESTAIIQMIEAYIHNVVGSPCQQSIKSTLRWIVADIREGRHL